MSKALVWIRKSKGQEDDIGLEEHREKVIERANSIADEVVTLDLGIHTGFSTMSRDDDSGLLDQNERVQQKIESLEAGEYDYLVALDDRRVCRDEFFSVIEYACKCGEADLEFVNDVERDDLTFDIKRRVERDTKEEEIEKSKQAVEARLERGFDHGRPPTGFRYDDAGEYWVPDMDSGEFDRAIQAIEMVENGASYAEVNEELGFPRATVSRIVNRKEMYFQDSAATLR